MAIMVSIAMMIGIGAFPTETYATGSIGLDAARHTEQQIKDYVASHPWNTDDVTYSSEPSITAPYAIGRVSDQSASSALNYLNIFRYIAGVDPVAGITDDAMDYAQAASLCMAVNRSLTHTVDRPDGMSDEIYSKAVYGAGNSNIAGGGQSITNTILRYMQEINGDSYYGHRRQLLDPYYKEAGFGSVASSTGSYYSATFVDANMKEDKAISYPGQVQPLEYFGTGYAWTVIVPQKIDTQSAHVKITETAGKDVGKTWEFSNTSDTSYEYMRIDQDYDSACLIFAPSDIQYRDGDVYHVEITDIPSKIEYDVDMFNIETIPVESVKMTHNVPETIKGRSVNDTSGVVVSPSNASNKIMKWTSSDDSVATVKSYGTSGYEITGIKEGKVTITGIPEGGNGQVQFDFEVLPAPTGIDVPDEITIGVGQEYNIRPKAVPDNTPVSCSLRSSDGDIAKVSSGSRYGSYIITGKSVGTTSVKANLWYQYSGDSSYRDLDKDIVIRVVDPVLVEQVSIDGPDTLNVGDKAKYVTEIKPDNATLQQLDWTVTGDFDSGLSVDMNGIATAAYKGKYTITAEARDGSGISGEKEVTVYVKYATPEAPIAATVTETDVYLKTVYGCEYSMDGVNWQTSRVFRDLKPDTEYTFYQRRYEDLANYSYASDISPAATVVTKPCSHYWKESKVLAQPTCTEEGSRELTCTVCGEVKTESIPATGHEWASTYTVDKAATCTAEGSESIHCTQCGEVKPGSSRAIAKKAHTYGDWTVKTEPTCTKTGVKERKCSVCGDVITESIPATGHEWASTYTVDKAATCTAEGSESIHCTQCDEVKPGSSRAIAKKSHTYGSWIITKEATTDAAGSREKVCSVCADKVTESIPKLEKPAEPETPTKPSEPETPSQPEEPAEPSEPETPSKPEEPAKPADPDEDTTGGDATGGKTDDSGLPAPGSAADTAKAKKMESGASAEAVDKVITSAPDDNDAVGSSYGLLNARVKTAAKNYQTIIWKNIGAAKYVIYGNKCGRANRMEKIAEVAGAASYKHTGLTKGTYYKYVVVALDSHDRLVSTSKVIHSATKGGKVGNHKSVKIKKKTVKLKKGKTFNLKGKAVAASKKLKVKNHRKVAYETTDPAIATVTKAGKIKAVGKGTCYIYAYAQNGMYVRCKVTVR